MTTRELNEQKKHLTCLGCGRDMVTDRCHRYCRICNRRLKNPANRGPRMVVPTPRGLRNTANVIAIGGQRYEC